MKHRCDSPAYRFVLLSAVLATAMPAHAEAACVAEPQAYRETDFRAATPCTLRGGTVLSTTELAALIDTGGIVLIDVLPAPRRPQGLPEDALWLPPERRSLPGSVWLPNTGFAVLPVEEEHYLRDNLRRQSAGDTGRALVFFCERDCWMSWNAAKRAIEWGYGNVYWYPDGSDGWQASGRTLVEVVPVERAAGQ